MADAPLKSGSPSTADSAAASAISKGLKGQPLPGTKDGRGKGK